MKYSRKELKQKLREVKQKHQIIVRDITLHRITGEYQGKTKTLSDHPIYCSHEHCRFWQRKTYLYSLKPKSKRKLEKEEEDED